MHFSSTLFVAVTSLALADGAVLGKRALSGEATFYGGNVAGGTCMFSTYTLPSNILGTALSDSNWDNAGNCGACVSVTGPSGNSIIAMVCELVDQCPGCGPNHLDLFPDAFAALANPTKGIIDIAWDYVDCPITSPLSLHNKDGVSAYWFSMQVVNANKAVASLDVSTDGGSTWQPTTRRFYNFFENPSGFGTTTVDVKVTSVAGDVVVVKNVQVSSGASTSAASNFGSSGAGTPQPAAPVSPPVAPLPATQEVESPPANVAPAPVPAPSSVSEAPSSPAVPGSNFDEQSVDVAPGSLITGEPEVVIVYVDECPA